MEDKQTQRLRTIQTIQLSLEESARPGFDDKDTEHLRVLVRLTVEFYDYLNTAPLWPPPSEPFNDMMYVIDSILINIDSFRTVLHSYGILAGSTRSTIDWSAIDVRSLKDEFISVYRAFVAQRKFEGKCRLLLDLVKLQIVFAGAFYDCQP